MSNPAERLPTYLISPPAGTYDTLFANCGHSYPFGHLVDVETLKLALAFGYSFVVLEDKEVVKKVFRSTFRVTLEEGVDYDPKKINMLPGLEIVEPESEAPVDTEAEKRKVEQQKAIDALNEDIAAAASQLKEIDEALAQSDTLAAALTEEGKGIEPLRESNKAKDKKAVEAYDKKVAEYKDHVEALTGKKRTTEDAIETLKREIEAIKEAM
jgi:chromosome segregation ATPase